MFKKAALAIAVLGAASSSFAAEPFFDDASLDLGFRTYYMQGEYGPEKHKALAQGFRADFNSGYFFDLIGLDAGVYTGFGLKTYDGEKGAWWLLDKNRSADGFKNEDTLKYGATIKVKAGDFGDLKYGTRKVNTHLYSDSDSRLTPELTQALSAELSFGDADAYVHQITRGSTRTGEELVDFTKKVYLVGGSYVFNNGLDLNAAYGQQKDRSKQYFGSVAMPFAVGEGTAVVAGNYQRINATGAEKVGKAEDSVNLWSVKASYEVSAVNVEVAYAKVGEYDFGINWNGGNGNGGAADLYTDNGYIISVDGNDTKSYYLSVGYDLSAFAPGVGVSAGYIKAKGQNSSDREYYATVGYDVQSVENLWVGAAYASTKDDDHMRAQLRYNFSAL